MRINKKYPRASYVGILTIVILFTSSCNKPTSKNPAEEVLNSRVDSVLALMTLEEKLGQLTLYTSDWDVTGPTMRDNYIEEIRTGRCGNIFNAHTVAYNRRLQKIAVEETRLGIPLLFGYDVIHGHKTIFPIPLAEACSWNIELIRESARLAAGEAAASGLSWTFGPMADISRDPRWGRVSEGSGEDAYLGSLIAAARVKGFQGDDLADPFTVAACIKHFAAYGAPIAGRDYNTVDMSEISFRQDYLPPYKAGIEAGAVTVMASFNELFGIPAHANSFLLTKILREELGFRGFVVADYTGVGQLVDHGLASDPKHAGELAIHAGMDMDMQSAIYIDFLKKSLDEGKVSISTIDEAVRRILRVKFQLGLFDDPYLYFDDKREAEVLYSEEIMAHALKSARESVVLLKNDPFKGKPILPISKNTKKIAVIGPLGNNQADMIGSWHGAGDASNATSVLDGLKKEFPSSKIEFSDGCDFYSPDKMGFVKALKLATNSDIIIVAIGEKEIHSGEAASRSNINIPGIQEELAIELIKTGKPVIVIILAERPLTFPMLAIKANTILYAWHLGTRAGDAIADIISGDYNPSGKLVMTFPRNVGQIPLYYNYKNTGRPFDVNNKYTTQYLDVTNDPQYPFGYGLSYTGFEYGPLQLSSDKIGMSDSLRINFTLKNTGEYDGEEIVQLYIRDLVGSVTRPVKELKGFKKIFLKKGEQTEISFILCSDDLRFYNSGMEYIAEPGEFKVYAGANSVSLKEGSFSLTYN